MQTHTSSIAEDWGFIEVFNPGYQCRRHCVHVSGSRESNADQIGGVLFNPWEELFSFLSLKKILVCHLVLLNSYELTLHCFSYVYVVRRYMHVPEAEEP